MQTLLHYESQADAEAAADTLHLMGHAARKLLAECVEKQGITRKSISKAAETLETAGFIFIRGDQLHRGELLQLAPSLAGEEALQALEEKQNRAVPCSPTPQPMTAVEIGALGYSNPRHIDGEGWCALHEFSFTWAILVGIVRDGYARRYCYETSAQAAGGLAGWVASEHPPGPWIKCKGAGFDLLNPEFGLEQSSNQNTRSHA